MRTLWAIQYGPYHGNGKGFLDWTTVRPTRKQAWEIFEANESPHATEKWKAEVKRRRRDGLIKAVRCTLERVEGDAARAGGEG